MKANEAPEKVYIEPSLDSIWGMAERSCESEVEYTRTDAFIEKAEPYLKEQFVKDVSILAGGVIHINFETAINNFINYMKGE